MSDGTRRTILRYLAEPSFTSDDVLKASQHADKFTIFRRSFFSKNLLLFGIRVG